MNNIHDNIIKYVLIRKTITTMENVKMADYIKLQKGGSKNLEVNYEDKNYKFIKNELDKNMYFLYAIDTDKSCVIIEVNKKKNIANIQKIDGTNKQCIKNGTRVGGTLLKLTLKLLIDYKIKLAVNVITLTDDSMKFCPANNKMIDMKIMQVLRTGDTWYGKYNFRPIESDNNMNITIHKYNNKLYEYNKNIMNTVTISSVNLLNFFNTLSLNPEILYPITQIINKKPNMLVKDFINKFFIHFYEFYQPLYDYLGLKKLSSNFYGLFI